MYDHASDSVAGYKGGNNYLFEYIEQAFQLQDTAAVISQSTFLTIASFLVDSAGNISQVTLTAPDKPHKEIPLNVQSELVIVLSEMPAWNPGYKNGEAVSSMIFLPLQFTVKDHKIHISTAEREKSKTRKPHVSGEKIILIIGAVALVVAFAFFIGGR